MPHHGLGWQNYFWFPFVGNYYNFLRFVLPFIFCLFFFITHELFPNVEHLLFGRSLPVTIYFVLYYFLICYNKADLCIWFKAPYSDIAALIELGECFIFKCF